MTPELEALGRRAVACERWRWMGGMLWIGPTGHRKRLTEELLARPDTHVFLSLGLPDFSDPATVGCLPYLVREAWGAAGSNVLLSINESLPTVYVDVIVDGDTAGNFRGPTLVAALVTALEASQIAT